MRIDPKMYKEFLEFQKFKELHEQASGGGKVQAGGERRKNQWTPEDDRILLHGVKQFGFKWTRIQKEFPVLLNKGPVATLRHRYMVLKNKTDRAETFSISCPKCQVTLTEKSFLQCTCGVTNRELFDALTDTTQWRSVKGYGLTRRLDLATIESFHLTDNMVSDQESSEVLIGNTPTKLSLLKSGGYFKALIDTPHKGTLDDSSYLKSTGILSGTLPAWNYLQLHICYRIGEMICRCRVPCTLRHTWNQMAGRSIYAPSEPIGIKPMYRDMKTCPDIDYSHGTIGDDDFYLKLVHRNRRLRETTKATYTTTIKWLTTNGLFDNNVVPEEFVQKCEDLSNSQSTLMMRLSVISIAFNNLRDDEVQSLYGNRGIQVRTDFYKLVSGLQRAHVQRVDNKMTEREEKNWMDFDELERVFLEYLEKNPPTTEDDARQVIIASLHILQAPLRGYHSVMISGYDPEKDNYLVLGDTLEESYFIFNQYKTDKSFGQVRLPVKERVYEILQVIVSRSKSNYLISLDDGRQMSTAVYSQKLGDFIEKITGKRIASQMIRKMYVSHVRKNELTAEQNRELSLALQHSEKMSREVYRVIN